MLVAENLTCMRSERTIFKGLGFCLQEGALLLLKGANGSGKTSLLKMIAGLTKPKEGAIYWNGAVISGGTASFLRKQESSKAATASPEAFRRRGISGGKELFSSLPLVKLDPRLRGDDEARDDFKRQLMMVGHKSAVKLDLTVEENLRFWGRLYGTEMLLPAALKFYNLGRYQETPCKELSAGWQRRVALARLIIAPCKLWLLDEPTNFLDEEAVLLTASLIESRVKQGGIVIAASHSMSSAVASHVLSLEDFDGKING